MEQNKCSKVATRCIKHLVHRNDELHKVHGAVAHAVRCSTLLFKKIKQERGYHDGLLEKWFGNLDSSNTQTRHHSTEQDDGMYRTDPPRHLGIEDARELVYAPSEGDALVPKRAGAHLLHPDVVPQKLVRGCLLGDFFVFEIPWRKRQGGGGMRLR